MDFSRLTTSQSCKGHERIGVSINGISRVFRGSERIYNESKSIRRVTVIRCLLFCDNPTNVKHIHRDKLANVIV